MKSLVNKAKTKDKRRNNGGPRPNSGRKPIKAHITNYHMTLNLLDEAAPKAMKVLTDCLKSDCEMIKLRAAGEILKKIVADKKQVEHSGNISNERKYDMSKLTDKELDALEKLQEKAIDKSIGDTITANNAD